MRERMVYKNTKIFVEVHNIVEIEEGGNKKKRVINIKYL